MESFRQVTGSSTAARFLPGAGRFAMGSLPFVGAGIALYFALTRGEVVGAMDLRTPDPRAAFSVASGDSISIEADIRATVSCDYLKEAVQRATLKLQVQGPAGAGTLSCSLWNGDAHHATKGRGAIPVYCGLEGLPTGCSMLFRDDGLHVVRASVDWAGLEPTAATLVVRRKPGDG
jgi:hypothetical protein